MLNVAKKKYCATVRDRVKREKSNRNQTWTLNYEYLQFMKVLSLKNLVAKASILKKLYK